MMKFFRKHNKKLLAIFMALLMIVFIGGSALQGMLTTSANYGVARSNYGDISLRDQQNASAATKLLSSMGMNWRYPAGGGSTPITEMDWILLSREAGEMGHNPDLSTVQNIFTSDNLNELARQFRVRPDHILDAIAQLNAIEQTALAVSSAATPSEAEIIERVRSTLQTVQINVVKLTAQMLMDENKEFSEAQIQEHFDKYREQESGAGLNFGYYIPPSVQVQYIEVNRDQIASQIGIPNLEKKAQEYYNERKTYDLSFRRPADQMNVEGEAPPPPPFLSWEEAKVIAMESVKQDQAKEAVNTIANWILQADSTKWVSIERDDSGYKKAPVAVADLDYYKNLIERIPSRINYPDAVRIWTSEFFTEESASDVPSIGRVNFQPSNAFPQSFGSLAFRTQAIVPEVPTGKDVNSTEYMANYQTCPYVLSDPVSGSSFIFRVVNARDGHIPDKIDVVREKVIADMKLAYAYREATFAAESIRGWDEAETLIEAYNNEKDLVDKQKKSGTMGTGYMEPAPFSKIPKYAASLGRPARGATVGAGLGLIPNDIVDQLFTLEHSDEKFHLYEIKDQSAVLVVEFVGIKHPMANEFEEMRTQLLTQLSDRKRRTMMTSWLDPEKIRARSGFALITKDEK